MYLPTQTVLLRNGLYKSELYFLFLFVLEYELDVFFS